MSKNTPRVCCPWASFPYKETLPIPHPFTLDLFVFLQVVKSKWTSAPPIKASIGSIQREGYKFETMLFAFAC